MSHTLAQGMISGIEPVHLDPVGSSLQVAYRIELQNEQGGEQRLSSHILEPGMGIELSLRGRPACRSCGKEMVRKPRTTVCYDCFSSLARHDLCFMSPDRCHFERGTCREPEWGERVCMQGHTVYVALTSGPKVGITREGRETRRWADQGAHVGLAVAWTPTRQVAGYIEAAARRWFNDRTDWRKLVQGQRMQLDIIDVARQLRERIGDLSTALQDKVSDRLVSQARWCPEQTPIELNYPIASYSPATLLQLTEDAPALSGNLRGIIGGYVLLAEGVCAIGDLDGGDVHARIGPPVADSEQSAPQMSLFE